MEIMSEIGTTFWNVMRALKKVVNPLKEGLSSGFGSPYVQYAPLDKSCCSSCESAIEHSNPITASRARLINLCGISVCRDGDKGLTPLGSFGVQLCCALTVFHRN
jgi:hypothetical protein